MGSEVMPDSMRMHFFLDAAAGHIFVNNFLNAPFNQLFPVTVDKNRVCFPSSQ